MYGHTFNVLNLSTGELVNDYERNRATMYKQNPYKQRVASPIAVWYVNPPDRATLIDIAMYLKLPLNALECIDG